MVSSWLPLNREKGTHKEREIHFSTAPKRGLRMDSSLRQKTLKGSPKTGATQKNCRDRSPESLQIASQPPEVEPAIDVLECEDTAPGSRAAEEPSWISWSRCFLVGPNGKPKKVVLTIVVSSPDLNKGLNRTNKQIWLAGVKTSGGSCKIGTFCFV